VIARSHAGRDKGEGGDEKDPDTGSGPGISSGLDRFAIARTEEGI